MEFAPLNANGCEHYVNDFYQEAPINKFFFLHSIKKWTICKWEFPTFISLREKQLRFTGMALFNS